MREREKRADTTTKNQVPEGELRYEWYTNPKGIYTVQKPKKIRLTGKIVDPILG